MRLAADKKEKKLKAMLEKRRQKSIEEFKNKQFIYKTPEECIEMIDIMIKDKEKLKKVDIIVTALKHYDFNKFRSEINTFIEKRLKYKF